jgi:hypothetical protein
MPSRPDSTPPTAERIEHLQRRRTRLLFFQGIFFLVWQTLYFSAAHETAGTADGGHVKVAAYVVWSIVLLAFIGTGGGYLQPKAVRAVLNDEVTIANRRSAMVTGYWVSMLVAIACYLLSFFETMTAREVIHIVLTAGVASALISLAVLERRAQGR